MVEGQEVNGSPEAPRASVTDINDRSPHVYGKATCAGCGYVWIAVAPEGTLDVKCPSCEAEKGKFVADPLGH